MPIRFRCAFCNQLMGISRRKAGTVVNCPKCAGQIVVPTPPPEEDDGPDLPQAAPEKPPGGKAGLFEQSDFEKIFEDKPAAGPQVLHQPGSAKPLAVQHRQPNPRPGPLEFDAVPLGAAKRPERGIFLTPGVLAVMGALVIVLMGLAFFLGLLLGAAAQ